MASKPSPRSSTSSNLSGFSRSATAIDPNSTRNTPQIPQQATASSATSSISSVSSFRDDDTSDSPFSAEAVGGWPRLAGVMAATPDFAAFPRFRELNVKSLLYYQVQLRVLQRELHEQEVLDKFSDVAKGFSECPEYMFGKQPVPAEQPVERLGPDTADGDTEGNQPNNPDSREETESKQFKIIKEIREVLKEYNDALLQYSEISALPDPDIYNVRSLRNWMGQEGINGSRIRGEGSGAWGKIEEDLPLWTQFKTLLSNLIWLREPPAEYLDLVATIPPTKLDGLTQWFGWYLVPFYFAWKDKPKKSKNSDIEKEGKVASGSPTSPPRTENGPASPVASNNNVQIKDPKDWVKKIERETTIESVSENSLLRITSGISTVVACLLPIGAIAVLSQVHGTRDLLLCLAGFSVIFCVVLIFLTQGTTKRVEIFSATAAFAAVMVVFMSDPVVVVTPGNPYPAPINITSPGN